MIIQLKRSLVVGGVGGLVMVIMLFYWLNVTGERDAYRTDAERQRDRVEILLENQQFQRRQIKALNSAMAKRDQTLITLANDIGASIVALEQLGERDAEAREWLDRDLPTGVIDWVRELQRTGKQGALRRPHGADSSNQ